MKISLPLSRQTYLSKHMGHLEPCEFCSSHEVETSISALGLFPLLLQQCSTSTKCFVANSIWEAVSRGSADFSPSCSVKSITPHSFPSPHESTHNEKVLDTVMKGPISSRAHFFQAPTHLCLVLFHLVFVSVNLPQQIFNSLVAELVPFAIALIQFSHLSYEKRGDLGREGGGRQELNQAEMKMPFKNYLNITLWSSLSRKNIHIPWKQVVLEIGQRFCLQTFNSPWNFQDYPFPYPNSRQTKTLLHHSAKHLRNLLSTADPDNGSSSARHQPPPPPAVSPSLRGSCLAAPCAWRGLGPWLWKRSRGSFCCCSPWKPLCWEIQVEPKERTKDLRRPLLIVLKKERTMERSFN